MKGKTKIRIVALSLGIPVFLGIVLIVSIANTVIWEKTENLMKAYTEGVSNGISSFFIDASAVASAASTLRSVQDLDWDVAGQDFTGFIRSNRFIHRISLVDTDGYLYDAYETGPHGNPWQGGRRTEDNSDPDSEPVTVTEREYFRALVAENVNAEFSVMVNEPFVPSSLTEKAIVTSVPVISGRQVVGAVCVAQTALELSQLYEELTIDFFDKFSNNSHMYLVSYGGQLVSDLEYNAAYGAYMDELFGSAEVVSVHTLGDDTVSAIDAAIRNEGRVVRADMHGERHFIAGVQIEDTPFAVCLAVSRNRMLSSSRIIGIIGIICLVLVALAVGVGFVFLPKVLPYTDEKGAKPHRTNRPDNGLGLGEDLVAPILPPNQD